jgi:glycerol uptake facilitator-like aquaporin
MGLFAPPAPFLSGRIGSRWAIGAAVALIGVFGVVRAGRGSQVAYAVGAYITAAYWFTSSTSFANPAVTIARMLSDTFAGIAPANVAMFVLMQLAGGVLGYALIRLIYPDASALAADVATVTEVSRTAASASSTKRMARDTSSS